MQNPVHDCQRWRKQHLFPVVLLGGCSSYCKRHVVCNFSPPADLPVSKKHCNHIFSKDGCFVAKEFLLRSFSIVMLLMQNQERLYLLLYSFYFSRKAAKFKRRKESLRSLLLGALARNDLCYCFSFFLFCFCRLIFRTQ